MSSIPNKKLNDGVEIPVLGYGTGTAWYKKDENNQIDRELVDAIKTAISLGYYHLDGAEVYSNERELGVAIKESSVPREKLFVTTKIITNIADISAAINTSLEKLQLDYVDLYLVHSPFFAKSDEELQKAWATMEKVKESGKARSIGVSNFLQPHLEAILKTAKVPPSMNQIEYHPYLQHGGLGPFHHEKGITTASYGPLTPITRAKGGPLDQTLVKLAQKYATTEGNILLRWSIDSGTVPITTSGKAVRLEEYLGVLKFQLEPVEVEEIRRLGDQKHYRAFWTDKFGPEDRS
ncbi:hypothetical protein AJ80_06418 [Polytolypa hystricis UAMH7299]|uniref:D-xylose reductase [NAD(P)H] n=1 Tax=Polytolypa hystricis (strain UAMH7299) TaxID=1447883 RepID=A0A2B7XX16_POLH7|nr:hypothetical protein AJ80_06418 [Polytolypa hystricis UAMH7299]